MVLVIICTTVVDTRGQRYTILYGNRLCRNVWTSGENRSCGSNTVSSDVSQKETFSSNDLCEHFSKIAWNVTDTRIKLQAWTSCTVLYVYERICHSSGRRKELQIQLLTKYRAPWHVSAEHVMSVCTLVTINVFHVFHSFHFWTRNNLHCIHPCRHQHQFRLYLYAAIIGDNLIDPYMLPEHLNGHSCI